MTAYEAPRTDGPGRGMRAVELKFHGAAQGRMYRTIVRIPKDMSAPDLIKYKGHTFVRRDNDHYSEASMWPVVDELDADTR